jgi:soluble lytic murein transglycosylase-like protein
MENLWRALLRSATAGAIVAALFAWSGRRDAVPLAAEVRVSAAPPQVARAADAWAVEVDGWRIVVDGVAVDPAALLVPEAVPLAPAGSDEFRGFAALLGRLAEEEGLDWRFVAAVAFEESRFDPYAVSPAGAVGLMQVRDVAARDVGVMSFQAPEANVRAGVKYLKAMSELYAEARGRDRLALMLAAYNMGPGHVADAQQLARELGFSPVTWDGSMAEMVRLLEQPAFHARLANGYAQGENVVGYVQRVLSRYGQYRRHYPSAPRRAPG